MMGKHWNINIKVTEPIDELAWKKMRKGMETAGLTIEDFFKDVAVELAEELQSFVFDKNTNVKVVVTIDDGSMADEKL